MKLIGNPVQVAEKVHTFDLEVASGNVGVGACGNASTAPTHSYQIVLPGAHAGNESHAPARTLVVHNTVSLLAGATPGVHYPISRCYIRRIRLSKDSDLVPALREAGFSIEPAVGSEKSTVVVEFPIKLESGIKSQNDVSIWEKLQLTKFMQEHWADNQVSVTIDFDREKEGGDIASALDYMQYHLKSVSFLPRDNNAYPQMPYESISEEKCDEMLSKIRPIKFPKRVVGEVSLEDKVEKDIFCDGDQCVIKIDNHRDGLKSSTNTSLEVSAGGNKRKIDNPRVKRAKK